MKRLSARAMTLIELLVVLAILAIVAAMVIPAIPHPDGSRSTMCLYHLRQIDLGFLLYESDNKGKFPAQFSVANGGTLDFLSSNQTSPHYQKLSPYIHNVDIFICPMDKNRQCATSYAGLADKNLSYFLNADVSTNNPTASILAGDRNLQANGQPVPPGVFVLTTNQNMSWTHELHPKGGCLAFGDGHAEFRRAADLNASVQRQSLATNRFSIP